MPISTKQTSEPPSNAETPETSSNSGTQTQTTTNPNPSSEPRLKTEAEEEADRLYEERIEEEYAKREGGA